MRLKPTPLVETSVVFSIAWLVTLVVSVFWRNDFNGALAVASAVSLLFLLPSYTLWAITGLIVKKRSHRVRFFWNLTITSAIALSLTAVIVNNASSKDLGVTGVFMGTIYFFASFIGAMLTFFVVTRPKKS